MFYKICIFISCVGLVIAPFTHATSLLLIPLSIILSVFKAIWFSEELSLLSKLMWTFLIVGLLLLAYNFQLGIKVLFGAAICLIIHIFKWIFLRD